MAEYLITKREKCEACDGKGYRLVNEDPLGIGLPCSCATGYIETPVDLLSVLARLRWNERVFGDDGSSIVHVRGLGTDVRIEG